MDGTIHSVSIAASSATARCTSAPAQIPCIIWSEKKRLTALLKDYTSAEQAAFGQAFQELANTVSRNVQCGIYPDILGDVFLELGAANRGMKQDFTPESIARLLARLTYRSSPDISEQGYFTLTDKTTPRLIQFHTLKNAANPPFLGGFSIFGTVAAEAEQRSCQGDSLFSMILCNDRKAIVTE